MAEHTFTTCLWYDDQAEEAARYYASIFEGARIGHIARYGKGAPMPEGHVLTVELELPGHRLLLLNGGPAFKLSEAISIIVDCDTQAEIDHLWDRLSEGGAKSRCGWLKDRFGLSWQVAPRQIRTWLASGDGAGSRPCSRRS